MMGLIRLVCCAWEKVVPRNQMKLVCTRIVNAARMFGAPVIRARVWSRALGSRAAKRAPKALCKLRLEERVGMRRRDPASPYDGPVGEEIPKMRVVLLFRVQESACRILAPAVDSPNLFSLVFAIPAEFDTACDAVLNSYSRA